MNTQRRTVSMDKVVEVRDAAIEQAVQEFNKAINKAYRKIERTGYPENPFSIAEIVIKRFWSQDKIIFK
jgi:hypothetical protein